MNEKGKLTLPHVFWDGFPNKQVAFRFLRQRGLSFSGNSYEAALSALLDLYGVDDLARALDEHIKQRLLPDDLNDIWRQYWANEIPQFATIRKADREGYRSWVEIGFDPTESVKDWSHFAHFYFQYLGDTPPVNKKRVVE